MSAVTIQLSRLLSDPATFKEHPNVVDKSFFFSVAESPDLWTEFQLAIQSNLQQFQSNLASLPLDNNDEGIASVTVNIDIDPRPGRLGRVATGPHYVLSFRDVLVLKSQFTAAGVPSTPTQLGTRDDQATGLSNLNLLMANAKNLNMIMALAKTWPKLYIGVVHPQLSSPPTVSDLRFSEGVVDVTLQEHQNLPLTIRGAARKFRSKPSEINQTACGQYLKLTYFQNGKTLVRYYKVLGGVPEQTFPSPLPLFDLSEIRP